MGTTRTNERSRAQKKMWAPAVIGWLPPKGSLLPGFAYPMYQQAIALWPASIGRAPKCDQRSPSSHYPCPPGLPSLPVLFFLYFSTWEVLRREHLPPAAWPAHLKGTANTPIGPLRLPGAFRWPRRSALFAIEFRNRDRSLARSPPGPCSPAPPSDRVHGSLITTWLAIVVPATLANQAVGFACPELPSMPIRQEGSAAFCNDILNLAVPPGPWMALSWSLGLLGSWLLAPVPTTHAGPWRLGSCPRADSCTSSQGLLQTTPGIQSYITHLCPRMI